MSCHKPGVVLYVNDGPVRVRVCVAVPFVAAAPCLSPREFVFCFVFCA